MGLADVKVVANFYVLNSENYCELRPMPDKETTWVFTAIDNSEEWSCYATPSAQRKYFLPLPAKRTVAPIISQ
eukprot:1374511-Amphidinium_carterae.2